MALTDQSFEAQYKHHIAALASVPPPVAKDSKLPSLSKPLKGDDGKLWERSTANEFGRLFANGVGHSRPSAERIEGTGTLFPIRKNAIPKGRNITYANFICAIRPQKAETHRVRLTFGGDKLDFPGDPSSPAVSLLTTKIHINSTISDAHKGARYCTLDVKDFFLGSPMEYRQYARVHASLIPDEIFLEYPDLVVETDGYVYIEARKGIYGLKEAGLLAFNHLVTNLKPFGYEPVKFTPGHWRHCSPHNIYSVCTTRSCATDTFTKH